MPTPFRYRQSGRLRFSRGRAARGCAGLFLLALSLAFGAGCAPRRYAPNAPLPVSLWYWHQPFRIPPADLSALKAAGIDELFVRAGTFVHDSDSGAIRLVLPQVWTAPAPDLPVQLVFNFDYGIVRRFESIPVDALAATVAATIRRERNRATAAGLRVTGVQLDFDCPTRLLPRYADLLGRLRASGVAPPGTAFSVTALPTWLKSDTLRQVAAQVDFVVPQFYEAQIPKDRSHYILLSDERRVAAGLRAAERLGIPFRAGLPAYGHALVYDGAGHLRGVFHDASVTDTARNPNFRFLRSFAADRDGKAATAAAAYTGEDIVEFGPAAGGGPDFRLLYELPSDILPARQIACVRSTRPRNCAGVILYRYPEQNATEAVPLPALLAVVRGRTPAPHLKIKIWSRAHAPWNRIEDEGAKAAEGDLRDVYVSATNMGDGATGIAPDAAQIVLNLSRPGTLRETEAGGFLAATPEFAGSRCSPERADSLLLSALRLAPGETITSGPLRLQAGASIRDGKWRAADSGRLSAIEGSFSLSSAAAIAAAAVSSRPAKSESRLLP